MTNVKPCATFATACPTAATTAAWRFGMDSAETLTRADLDPVQKVSGLKRTKTTGKPPAQLHISSSLRRSQLYVFPLCCASSTSSTTQCVSNFHRKSGLFGPANSNGFVVVEVAHLSCEVYAGTTPSSTALSRYVFSAASRCLRGAQPSRKRRQALHSVPFVLVIVTEHDVHRCEPVAGGGGVESVIGNTSSRLFMGLWWWWWRILRWWWWWRGC